MSVYRFACRLEHPPNDTLAYFEALQRLNTKHPRTECVSMAVDPQGNRFHLLMTGSREELSTLLQKHGVRVYVQEDVTHRHAEAASQYDA